MSDLIERLRGTTFLQVSHPHFKNIAEAAHEAADEIERLERELGEARGLLTRIHGIAAEPRPVNMAVRLENIACIASGERDATYAQLAEAQRFPHGAAAVTGCDMKINDEGSSNAAYWYERAMKAEARLQKIMARCADLLDEDQFNELDAMTRATVTVTGSEP
jgi:hypothetical protein